MIMMVIMNVTCTVVFHALQQNLHIKNIQDDSDPLIKHFWVKFDYEKFFVLTLFTGFLACVSDSFTPAATPTIPFTVPGGLFICAFGSIVILITTHTTSLLTRILDSLTKTTESFDSSTPSGRFLVNTLLIISAIILVTIALFTRFFAFFFHPM